MLIVLSGPSAVGKSFTTEYLCRYFDFRAVTPFTTRAPRSSESEGLHYHFRSEKDLRELTANFSRGYWGKPLGAGQWYGYTEHVDDLGPSSKNWVIHSYSDLALKMREAVSGVFLVFLDFETDEAMIDRITERFGNDENTLSARLDHARHERSNQGHFDIVVRSDNPEKIAEEVSRFALSKVIATPSRTADMPGPLSDLDLRASLADAHGLRVYNLSEEAINSRIRGWSLDLTLSSRYYRVVQPRIMKRVFDLAAGDPQEIFERFREHLVPEGKGIYLKPREFILACTRERLQIPANLVGLISGRSSYARMGVSVELSQIILQPGHNDAVPLQIQNALPYPIIIYPGTSIAQAVFFKTVSTSGTPYNKDTSSKYITSPDDIRSRFYLDHIYHAVNEKRPSRKEIDWDFILNFLLLLLAWVAAASWMTTKLPGPEFAEAGKQVSIISFALMTLMAVARIGRFFRGHHD